MQIHLAAFFTSNDISLRILIIELETRDGKRSYDAGPHSPEMARLNSSFGKWHGISSLLNLVSLLATAWHGILLSERL